MTLFTAIWTLLRTYAAALTGASAILASLAMPAALPGEPAAAQDLAASAAAKSAPTTTIARTATKPRWEVWQKAEKPHPANRSNPLANRVWGVYDGPQDQVWGPYRASKGKARALISKIALRPRTKWYGSWISEKDIRSSVRKYIEESQDGDSAKLVQMAVFRMTPWEHAACARPSTKKELTSYRRWISSLARGIGSTPTLIVMQPDMPFLWCVPDLAAKSRALTWATQKLSALPNTSVYLDAGAADWCENGRGNNPERCAALLKRTGIRYARGFALDSTHYTGPAENIHHGTKIVKILKRDGFGAKHFIIDTAKSGRPMMWADVIPANGQLKDNARTCSTKKMRRCVTLGIPPTAQPAADRYGLPAGVRKLAAKHVDGFVWFGRPWLHNQADPFVKQRALDMGRTTPWPGPRTR